MLCLLTSPVHEDAQRALADGFNTEQFKAPGLFLLDMQTLYLSIRIFCLTHPLCPYPRRSHLCPQRVAL